MKKTTTSRLWSCLFAALLLSPAFSQPGNQVAPSPKPNGFAPAPENVKASTAVSDKVLRSFEQSFKDAQDVYWTTAQNNSVVEFQIGDRKAVALFNKSGRLRHTILYGTARDLPAPEWKLVHSAYPGYEISTTQEITVDGEHLWVVMVQNCSDIIRVRVMDNDLYELEHLRKF